jgi:hypothetical protein
VNCLPNHPIIVFAGQTGLTYQISGAFLTGSDIKIKGNQRKANDYNLFK